MVEYSSYINSQLKYLKEDYHKERRWGSPFVTISRETGAQGTTFAKELADYLQKYEKRKRFIWTVFSKELLKKVIEHHNLPETVLPYLSKSTASEIEDILEESLGLHPSQYMLAHKTSETILYLARLGYVILVGRGSNIVTAQLPGGLHLRLVGGLENRVKCIEKNLNLDEVQARKYVAEEEKNRSQYVKKYFGKEIGDPLQYDLVINIDRFPLQKAIPLIGDFILGR